MNLLPMRKFWVMLSSLATVSLLTVAGYGQTPAPTTTSSTEPPPVMLQKFEVTGSYLPTSAGVNASPVVTIDSSDISLAGATDPLRMLRQLTPFFSGSGNAGTESNNGSAGESYVSLRNLTTLVLVNGQRITGSPFSSGTAVDLNSIPTAMIDHTDILKDGASTIYGSDAIGGVVNIVLKKDYNGFVAGLRYGSTRNGDYKTREAYIQGGVAANGASLTFGAQHFENTTLLGTSRPITTLSGADVAAMGFNPTSSVFSGSYPGRVNSLVLAGSVLSAAGATGFNASITSPGIKSSPTDTSVTNGLSGAAALAYLQSKGIYLVAASTPQGLAVGGSATSLNTTLFGNPVMTGTKRNQFVLNGSKELIGKSLEVFGDFLFSQTNNGGSGLAPSPIAGVGPAGLNTLFIPANNPYNVFNVDFPGPLSARTRTVELGPRFSLNETNTFRVVTGFKGEINDNYSWQLSYNYSRSSLTQRILGGANGANMNAAMVPLLSSTGGYVYNAAGKPLSTLTDSNGNNLPVYNYFALPGFNDPATLAALGATLFQSGDTSLRNIRFVVNGKPFELPAGSVSFALGIETRAENISGSVDALFANGLALGYNPASTFSGGSRSTRGAFLELGVPGISPQMNVPGFHLLDFNLADRYEEIKPGGNANTPKVGLRWMPIDDSFVIRGTFADGFIAPSVFSLFGPAVGNSPTLTVFEGDGSAGSGGTLTTRSTVQVSANQLSNPNLAPSKSKSWTAGFVYSPKAIRGLSFTADYYKVTQTQVGGIDYTAIAASLNAQGSASPYAAGFVFGDGSVLKSAAANQVNTTNFGSITVTNIPTGEQWTNGMDLSVDYKFATESLGRFGIGASANVLFNYKAQANSSAPVYQYARTYTDGSNGAGFANGLLPSYTIKPYITNVYGPVSTSLFVNYVAPVKTTGGVGVVQGQDGDRIDGMFYTVPSYITADLAVSYTLPSGGRDWLRNLSITVGANNVFNKKPPYVPVDGNPPGEGNTVSSTYDIIGRFMFMEVKKSF